ncbi:MAG TPA: HNH endonuclease [Candidatus Thermoplasmatota archaeon]
MGNAIKTSAWRRRKIQKEIGDRDAWQCKLCGQPVDPLLPFDDPMRPSLDHIVPKSLGGTNARHNLRLTHHVCNHLRGIKPA